MSVQTVLVSISVAVLVAGMIAIFRRRARWRRPGSVLDDRAIRQIEQQGWVSLEDDEPLDWDQIDAEEKRFWTEERWDSADEW